MECADRSLGPHIQVDGGWLEGESAIMSTGFPRQAARRVAQVQSNGKSFGTEVIVEYLCIICLGVYIVGY